MQHIDERRLTTHSHLSTNDQSGHKTFMAELYEANCLAATVVIFDQLRLCERKNALPSSLIILILNSSHQQEQKDCENTLTDTP